MILTKQYTMLIKYNQDKVDLTHQAASSFMYVINTSFANGAMLPYCQCSVKLFRKCLFCLFCKMSNPVWFWFMNIDFTVFKFLLLKIRLFNFYQAMSQQSLSIAIKIYCWKNCLFSHRKHIGEGNFCLLAEM